MDEIVRAESENGNPFLKRAGKMVCFKGLQRNAFRIFSFWQKRTVCKRKMFCCNVSWNWNMEKIVLHPSDTRRMPSLLPLDIYKDNQYISNISQQRSLQIHSWPDEKKGGQTEPSGPLIGFEVFLCHFVVKYKLSLSRTYDNGWGDQVE